MKEIRKTGKIKGLKITLYGAIFFCLMFAFTSPASATIYTQPLYTESAWAGNVRQFITGAEGAFNSVTFKVAEGTIGSTFRVQIANWESNCSTYAGWYSNTLSKDLGGTYPAGGEMTFYYADFRGAGGYPQAFEADHCYEFLLYQIERNVYGTIADSYANGFARWEVGEGLGDLYFILDAGVAIPAQSIDFVRPMPDQTLADFSDWQVEYLLPVKWEGYYHLLLSYAPQGLFPYYLDETWTAGGDIGLHQFPKRNLLTNGDWQANIEIWAEGEKLLESGVIDFTIFNEYEGGVLPPAEPPVITCGETDFVCQLTKWLTDSFNKLISYLFIPSGASINRFSTLWEPISKKPPIGYFMIIRDRLAELGEGTAGFVLAGTAGLTAVLAPLKTGISFCLWLLFSFWLFKRIAHLDI